jgi:hypothetical protein
MYGEDTVSVFTRECSIIERCTESAPMLHLD